MKICVVGLGKIGLPLAVQYALKGHPVLGCDIDPGVVAAVNEGRSPVAEERGLPKKLAEAVSRRLLRATTDTTPAVEESSVVVVIVPLIVDKQKEPDFRALDAATAALGRGLRPGSLVIYETTLPVGTTRNRLGPALERASGLRAGTDFGLAYSPERVSSGRIFADLKKYPKLVGGIDAESTRRAAAFYQQVLDAEIMPLSCAEAAEFAKLIEATYRDVNIALANEFARCAAQHRLDIMEAIQAANTQPFSHIHAPGLGVGGHCIPVYPYFLLNSTSGLEIPRAARRINDSMVGYALGPLREALGGLQGKTVLILGLAYRGDVKEAAFSPALRLIGELRREGAKVLAHDPLFSSREIAGYGVAPADLGHLPSVDAVVLQAYHRAYRKLDFALFKGCRVVLDGRNALSREVVEAAGLQYLGIGRV